MGAARWLERRGSRAARTFPWWAVLAACGRAEEPRWIALSAHREATLTRQEASRHAWREGREIELRVVDGETTLALPLAGEDWVWSEEAGLWNVALPLRLSTQRGAGALRLTTPEEELPRETLADLVVHGLRGFTFKKGALGLGGFPDGPPPEATLLCTVASDDLDVPGRVLGRRLAGSGVALVSGATAAFTLDVPRASALRFATFHEDLLDLPRSGAGTARVRLNGTVVLEVRADDRVVWHELPLPEDGLRSARIELEAEGGLAHWFFLDPCIGPREVGRPGHRPWSDARPDLLVVLADTFRADNLAAYGGPEGLTPHLDALARRGLVFENTWSTASWTLPAHASLLTGLYPMQVLTPTPAQRMPASVTSIAEELARAGYRTGAVTDGGFVSSQFGLDQGFATFLESETSLGAVEPLLEAARAFLEADDGRPVFLFLQSYRAHWPYRVSAETRAAWGARLGIAGDARELFDELADLTREPGAKAPRAIRHMRDLPDSPRIRALVRGLEAHYRGGAADLDRALGGFLEFLDGRDWLATGALAFTSDHGEAFHEHAALFHSGVPFEEQVRIPLVLAGRGLGPARRADPASLVDLAPTLAELAGLEPASDLAGRSLLRPAPRRPLLGFECGHREPDSFFLLEEAHKVLALREGSGPGAPLAAYDLGTDGHETRDLAADAPWPRELLGRHAGEIEQALQPRFDAGAGVRAIDDEKAAELRALGY